MSPPLRARILIGLLLGFLGVAGYLLISAPTPHSTQTQTRFLMGTYCRIDVVGDENVIPAINAAFEQLEELDLLLNARNTNSPLHAFNSLNQPITNPTLASVVRQALAMADETAGAFDPTVLPLMDLWGFYSPTPAVPSVTAIDAALLHTGWRALRVTASAIEQGTESRQMDLGGIGQGYAIGEAAAVLRNHGVESALIDLGGDLYALGANGKAPWRIGIRAPRGDGFSARVGVANETIVTSGDYENCFETNGVRYGHILDPATGRPATDLISVTIIMADPVRCDAFSTALFVMGMKRGRVFLSEHPEIDALLIGADGTEFATPGFARRRLD